MTPSHDGSLTIITLTLNLTLNLTIIRASKQNNIINRTTGARTPTTHTETIIISVRTV